MKFCIDSQCKRAGQLLPRSDFYVKRDSWDHRDPYCKECRSRRVHEAQARARVCKRNQKLARPERKANVIAKCAFSLVYDAINRGKTTREDIRKETGLNFDVIGDCLVELIYDCKAVRIRDREFHLVDSLAA